MLSKDILTDILENILELLVKKLLRKLTGVSPLNHRENGIELDFDVFVHFNPLSPLLANRLTINHFRLSLAPAQVGRADPHQSSRFRSDRHRRRCVRSAHFQIGE